MTPFTDLLLNAVNDPEGKRAEQCLLSLVTDLEKAGVSKRSIARATARVLLGFCVESGREYRHFGWANSVLSRTGELLEKHAYQARRRWVKHFMAETGRLYRDAAPMLDIDHAEVVKASEAQLAASEAQGQA